MASTPDSSEQEIKNRIDKRLANLEERLDVLEKTLGTYNDTPLEEASPKEITIGGMPIGKSVENNKSRIRDLRKEIQNNETRVQPGGSRGEMVPAHRMYGDAKAGSTASLNGTQRRAAEIFGQFVERVVNEQTNPVDASGQKYSLTSKSVEEILLGKHNQDSQNLLKGVKKESRSQVVARAMRETARLSKTEDCGCEDIENCTHALIKFRAGKPNALASSKEQFREVMKSVYQEDS